MTMNIKNTLYRIVMLLGIALLVIGCQPQGNGQNQVGKMPKSDLSGPSIKKFESQEELIKFLEEAKLRQDSNSYYGGIMMERSAVMSEIAPQAKAVSGSADSSSAGAAAYSQTNVQVEGIDEADFVKNDGKYIYTIVQDKLIITDAFPPENAKIVSETKINGTPRNMYVNGEKLALFVDGSGTKMTLPRYGLIPQETYVQKTHVLIFDISDRENPRQMKDYNLDGYYLESRMIGNQVYFISQDNVYYYNNYVEMPIIRQGETKIASPQIYYFDNPEYSYLFHTVASFDINGEEDKVNAKTFMMGYSNAIYVSNDNIYISYQKNLPWRYHEDESEKRFYEIALPNLPSDIQQKINEVKNDNSLNAYEKWSKISDIIGQMYNSISEGEKKELMEKIQDSLDQYDVRLQQERQKTVIHRLSIDEGDIEYGAKGEVPGYLLSQFSMDEHNGNLRLATTSDYYNREETVQYNNVYILNERIETIGKKEGIAAKERIYSTRFIGDRLYMVTFERIDPFFVIDLKNPQRPEILGELKIPGYSDYLHPYDENHIIGIGKDTKENEWGGISTTGIKLALFDVSDVANPKQVANYRIGSEGTDSEALQEHKAFLFDKEKSLLVIPIREIQGKPYFDDSLRYYRQKVWQGAYVLGLTPEKGFDLLGKITHGQEDENQWWYYGSPSAVRRALYMDDILYTVSLKMVKANSLNDIKKEVASVALPYEEPNQIPYPLPYYKGGVAEGSAVDVAVSEPGAAKSPPSAAAEG